MSLFLQCTFTRIVDARILQEDGRERLGDSAHLVVADSLILLGGDILIRLHRKHVRMFFSSSGVGLFCKKFCL